MARSVPPYSRGAKSDQLHTTPLVYRTDGDRIIVIGAHLDAPRHFAWYHNLLASPEVTVELGTERSLIRAVVAEGKERKCLFSHYAEQAPGSVGPSKKER